MPMNAAHLWSDPEARKFAPPAIGRQPYSDYVSAACLEVRGLADREECYEVRLLRLFVREYVEKLRGGAQMIADYREKSPAVTCAIEHHPDRLEIYVELYERFIGPFIEKILHGRWEEAHEAFGRMRQEIEDRFLRGVCPGARDVASSAATSS